MQVFAVAIIVLTASCSGSGGFNEGVKLGKKSENKKEEANTGENLGIEKDADDTADQPVQITGTYLTCVETESTDSSARIGCRVASKKDGSTVELNTLASDWTFDYQVTTIATGSVTVKASKEKSYHVFFDFEASSKAELKVLLSVTKIILDMIYLPGVGTAGSGPAFSGLVGKFIPKSSIEATSGSQGRLDENIVGTQDFPNPGTTTPSIQKPDTTPAKPANPAKPVEPVEPAKTPATVQTPRTPEADSGTPISPVVQSTTPAKGVAVDPKDPVAFFTLGKAVNGTLTLQAYFDQISGLTNPTFTGAKNLSYAGGAPYSDGTAMIMLTTPMAVSVKKGEKTCTGNGTIGAGVISIPLTCK